MATTECQPGVNDEVDRLVKVKPSAPLVSVANGEAAPSRVKLTDPVVIVDGLVTTAVPSTNVHVVTEAVDKVKFVVGDEAVVTVNGAAVAVLLPYPTV